MCNLINTHTHTYLVVGTDRRQNDEKLDALRRMNSQEALSIKHRIIIDKRKRCVAWRWKL